MPRSVGELLAGQLRGVEDNQRQTVISAAEDGRPQSVEILAGLTVRPARQGDELAVDDALVGQQLDELVAPARRRALSRRCRGASNTARGRRRCARSAGKPSHLGSSAQSAPAGHSRALASNIGANGITGSMMTSGRWTPHLLAA